MLVSGGAKGVRGAHIRAGGVGDALRTYGGWLLIVSIRKHLLEHNTQASKILNDSTRLIGVLAVRDIKNRREMSRPSNFHQPVSRHRHRPQLPRKTHRPTD